MTIRGFKKGTNEGQLKQGPRGNDATDGDGTWEHSGTAMGDARNKGGGVRAGPGAEGLHRARGTNQFTVRWEGGMTHNGVTEGTYTTTEPNRAPGGGRNPALQTHAPWNDVYRSPGEGRLNIRQDVENTGDTPGPWDAPQNAKNDSRRDLEAKALNAFRVRNAPAGKNPTA